MGATKVQLFTEHQNEMANIAKALGHPARIAIMQHLIKVDACICNDFVEEFQLAQPTISQHLKELKNAGLIKGNVEGTSICYCIDKNILKKVVNFFGGFLSDKRNNCC